MTRSKISIWHCLWGLPFLLIGGGFFFHALFHGLGHITDSLTQVVVPGRAELNLRRGFTYTVFLEEESVVNGKVYSTTQSVAGLECRARSLQDGAAIAIRKASMGTTYTLGGRSGHSVLEFPIQEDGKYLFACDYGENSKGPEVVVAVGTGIGAAIARTVVEALGALFGGVGLCLIVVLAVLIKSEREKRRIRQLGQAQV